MKFPDMFFIFLFYLFHYSFYFYKRVRSYERQVLQALWIWFNSSIWRVSKKPLLNSDLKLLNEECGAFKNIPKHLSIVVHEKDINVKQLADIALWSVVSGIYVITFYDYHGNIKKNAPEVKNMFEKKFKVLCGVPVPQVNLIYRVLENHELLQNGHGGATSGKQNGVVKQNVYISLLSVEDGCDDIANAARKICNNVQNGSLDISDIHMEEVERNLSATNGLVDPDFLIAFGNTKSVGGFLPWQIRYTEMMFQETHHHFNLCDFYNGLCHFSNIQQRFGK